MKYLQTLTNEINAVKNCINILEVEFNTTYEENKQGLDLGIKLLKNKLASLNNVYYKTLEDLKWFTYQYQYLYLQSGHAFIT